MWGLYFQTVLSTEVFCGEQSFCYGNNCITNPPIFNLDLKGGNVILHIIIFFISNDFYFSSLSNVLVQVFCYCTNIVMLYIIYQTSTYILGQTFLLVEMFAWLHNCIVYTLCTFHATDSYILFMFVLCHSC